MLTNHRCLKRALQIFFKPLMSKHTDSPHLLKLTWLACLRVYSFFIKANEHEKRSTHENLSVYSSDEARLYRVCVQLYPESVYRSDETRLSWAWWVPVQVWWSKAIPSLMSEVMAGGTKRLPKKSFENDFLIWKIVAPLSAFCCPSLEVITHCRSESCFYTILFTKQSLADELLQGWRVGEMELVKNLIPA